MDIYLIRHTPIQIENDICYGQSDVGLEDQIVQAEMPALPEDTVIISSPLQRCLELANNLSHSPIIDKRIMELNFGDWEMQKWDDINQESLQEWMNDYINIAPPGGESLQALSERCQDFWNDLITKETSQAVVVITHLGVIRALLAQVLEIPLEKSLCIQVDYGAINKLTYHTSDKTNEAWVTIEYLNQSSQNWGLINIT